MAKGQGYSTCPSRKSRRRRRRTHAAGEGRCVNKGRGEEQAGRVVPRWIPRAALARYLLLQKFSLHSLTCWR